MAIVEIYNNYIEKIENLERVLIRDGISGREKNLGAVTKIHEIINYTFFHNAGYMRIYNKSINELKKYKGLNVVRNNIIRFYEKRRMDSKFI